MLREKMRFAVLFLALPLVGCASDYPSAHGPATSVLPKGEGGRGVWAQPYVNPIGAGDVARTYYARLPAYKTDSKPAPQPPAPLKTPQELAQEEGKLNGLREGTKAVARGQAPTLQDSQKSDAELAALRDKTRARAAAEAQE